MSGYVWDLSGTDTQCASYWPGHQIHWIHFNHSMREPSVVIPVTAVVDDDGLVHIEGDDLTLVRWNHSPALLRAALQRFGGMADWKPRWHILAVPTEAFMGSARTVFNLAALDERTPCIPIARQGSSGATSKSSARSSSMPVSAIFRRSSLGVGWYVIREDDDCGLPDARAAIYEAVVLEGACAVCHGGMYESNLCAIALPGGWIYEVASHYGFGGLPDRVWIFGARALRQIMRRLNLEQPRRLLSGEASIPANSDLVREWDGFARQDRLTRVGQSLGVLRGMLMRAYLDEPVATSSFEPIALPVRWSQDNPPPGVSESQAFGAVRSMFDPRIRDAWFWKTEWTNVRDSSGWYRLTPDGKMTPH